MYNELTHENFILKFPHTRYQQSACYFNNKKEEKFLIQIRDNGKLKLSGAVFLRTSENGKCKLYCPRGPIFAEDDIHYFKYFLLKAEKLAIKYNATKIICNPLISNTHKEYLKLIGCEVIDDPTKTMLPPNEICIKADSENEMLTQMSKSCRKNIKKAISHGLESVELENINSSDLDTFYNLYIKTAQRKQFLIHEKQYFRDLLSKMDKKHLRFNQIKIGKKIIAMSIDYLYNKALECLYSFSDSDFNDKKVGNMLHWGRMLYCVNNQNIDYFLCGGVYCNEKDIQNKDYGVYQFKSSLCGGKIKKHVGDIIYRFKR